MFKAAVVLVSLAIGATPTAASAFTHCTAKVSRIWAGDNGHVFVSYIMSNGVQGDAVMTPTNPNREAVLALSVTAMTTSRQITVRLTPDGASCAGPHFDVQGVYLEP